MKHAMHVRPIGRWAAALTLGCALTFALCACGASEIQSSASEIAPPAALADDCDAALAAVREKADDAKLVAVRSSADASAQEDMTWMYLFASAERAYSYTAFVADGEATAADYATASYAESDMQEIPDPGSIAFDAPEAYAKAVESLTGDGKIAVCSAFMILHDKSDEADPAPLVWRFTFNDPESLKEMGINDTQGYADRYVIDVDATTGEASTAA